MHDQVQDELTPYELRCRETFSGCSIPFGCRVDYKPNSERKTGVIKKCGSRTLKGTVMGYHVLPGGRWSGDYLILDAMAYQNAKNERGMYIHRVKEIVPESPPVFSKSRRAR